MIAIFLQRMLDGSCSCGSRNPTACNFLLSDSMLTQRFYFLILNLHQEPVQKLVLCFPNNSVLALSSFFSPGWSKAFTYRVLRPDFEYVLVFFWNNSRLVKASSRPTTHSMSFIQDFFKLKELPVLIVHSSSFVMATASSSRQDAAVQSTNDDAATCKCSAVRLGYWKDPYVQFFAKPCDRKPPEINRGYYARVKGIDSLLKQFLQVVSLTLFMLWY